MKKIIFLLILLTSITYGLEEFEEKEYKQLQKDFSNKDAIEKEFINYKKKIYYAIFVIEMSILKTGKLDNASNNALKIISFCTIDTAPTIYEKLKKLILKINNGKDKEKIESQIQRLEYFSTLKSNSKFVMQKQKPMIVIEKQTGIAPDKLPIKE